MACGPQRPLKGIPKDKLEDVIAAFHEDDPAPLSLDVKLDTDGTYTVSATYPPCPDGTAGKKPPAAKATTAASPSVATSAPLPHVSLASRSGMTGVFPPDLIAAAKASQQKWQVRAAVTLAQWALESAWGRTTPPGSNNPFGIKAKGNQPYVEAPTKEYVHGRYVRQMAKFRVYTSIDAAFEDHGRLLATGAPYKKAMQVVADVDAFVDAIAVSYATDPTYARSLHFLIQKYDLKRYD